MRLSRFYHSQAAPASPSIHAPPANLRVHETNLPGTTQFLLEVKSALVRIASLRK